MKKLFIVLIGILLLSCNQQGNNREKVLGNFTHYKGIDTMKTIVIEQYQVDLDFDKQPDTIVLENVQDLVGDPHIFTIVKLKFASGNRFVIKDVAGYTMDVMTKKDFPNRIHSDKLYIPKFGNAVNYLIIWDYQYPGCDAIVSVFKVEKREVREVYKGSIYISEIGDFNEDGKIDLKGKTGCREYAKEKTVTLE